MAALAAGTASPATPVKWQEGNQRVAASVGTVPGLLQPTTAPPAFLSFPSAKEGEMMASIFSQFPSGASQRQKMQKEGLSL